MGSASVTPHASDGALAVTGAASWASARNATSAAIYGAADFYLWAAEKAGGVFNLYRVFVAVPIPAGAAGKVLSDFTLSFVYGGSGAGQTTAVLVASTQASPTSLASADFDNRGTTKLSDEIAPSAPGRYTWTANAAGLAYVQSKIDAGASYVTFALIAKKDADNSAPTDSNYAYVWGSEAAEANRPIGTFEWIDPTLDLVGAHPLSATTTLVTLDEEVTEASAEDASHWALDNGVAVTAAERLTATTVKLTHSALTAGTAYIITANSLVAASGNALGVATAALEGASWDTGICFARREGTSVRLAWASDPAIAPASHKIYRNGTLVATVDFPKCWALLSGDTAGDSYTVQGYTASLAGRIMGAFSRACSTLSVDDSDPTSVACAWTAVAGAESYKLYRCSYEGPTHTDVGWQDEAQWEEVYAGTGTGHLDTDPIDGGSYYVLRAFFADGSASDSARALCFVVRTAYVSPNERGLTNRWLPNIAPAGAIGGVDYNLNNYEHAQPWPEDVAQVLYAVSRTPVSWSRYAEAMRDYTLARMNNGTQVVQREFAWRQADAATPEENGYYGSYWDGDTGQFDTITHVHRFDLVSPTATWVIHAGEFGTNPTHADLRFGYSLGGGAVTLLGAFTTRRCSFDAINQRAVVTFGKTITAGLTVTITATIKHGRVTFAVEIENTTGQAFSLVVRDAKYGSALAHYSGAAYAVSGHLALGLPNSSSSGAIAHFKPLSAAAAWSYAGTTASGTNTFAYGTASPVAEDFLAVQTGDSAMPSTYYDDFGADLDETWFLGGPTAYGRVALGLTEWVVKYPEDELAKAELDAYLDAVYVNRDSFGNNTDDTGKLYRWAEKGLLLWCYKRLSLAWPGDTTYSGRVTTLVNEHKAATPGSYKSRYSTIALNLCGETTEAARWYLAATEDEATWSLGQAWIAIADKQSAAALNVASWLLRRNYFFNGSQQRFNDIYYPTAGGESGTTGEASVYAMQMLADIRNAHGDVTPIRVGNDTTSPWQFLNGTIGGYSYDPGTRVFSCTVDKTALFYCGRGKPTFVKKGGVALAESAAASVAFDMATNATIAELSNDEWYFDEALNVLVVKLGEAGGVAITFDVPEATSALATSNIDTAGCLLDWSVYNGADFSAYKVYRSTESGIDGTAPDVLLDTITDAGVNTFHDTTGEPGTEYFYRVLTDTTGDDVWSDEEQLTTLPVTRRRRSLLRLGGF